jgi:hypothetical protein
VLLVPLESFGWVRVHQVDLIMLLKFEYYFIENLMKNLIFKGNLACVLILGEKHLMNGQKWDNKSHPCQCDFNMTIIFYYLKINGSVLLR